MTACERKKPLTFDGYIRVSDVNGRGGESYRSPKDQRAIIERLAAQFGLTLDEVVSEEDVKGSTPIGELELGRLVRKVEEGGSGGLVVWNVKRYSRNWRDGILVADRIFAAGGRLIAEDFQHVGMGARSMLSFILELEGGRPAAEDRDVGSRYGGCRRSRYPFRLDPAVRLRLADDCDRPWGGSRAR